MVTTSSSDNNVKIYASKFTKGETGVVLVNFHLNPMTVSLTGVTSQNANGWIITSSSPNVADPLSTFGIAWNDATTSSKRGGPFPQPGGIQSLQPYVVHLTTINNGVQFNVPAASVLGIILY